MGLKDLLPESARKVLYAVYAFLGLAVTAVVTGFLAAPGGELPVWLVVAVAVYGVVGTGLGFTAAANTGNVGEVDERFIPSSTFTHSPDGTIIETRYPSTLNATEPHGAVPVPVYDAEARARYAEGGILPSSVEEVSNDTGEPVPLERPDEK